MLQRQIMFKQLQELQRRQQLQELSNSRNQNYVTGGQFSPMVNGTPIQDPSGMFMVGNPMPNGLLLSQTPSQPQSDTSLYANPVKNLDQYSHLHGPSNLSTNLLTKNNGNPFGMVSMQQSPFTNSFMTQQSNFPSDQEKDLFGQAPTEGLYGAALSEGRHEDSGWGRHEDSLDPLEQKILYNTDDNIWGSFSKMNSGGFEGKMDNTSNTDGLSSLQSGSWSALMQSALEETSGNDPGVQEEWSGLSFQNPEPSDDNQPTKLNNSQRLQNNWVNRNSPNVVSPSSKPEPLFQNFNNFANFQQPYHSETSHATSQNSPRSASLLTDYNSQQKHATEGTPLIQTSNIWTRQNKESPKSDVHEPRNLSNDNQHFNNFPGNELKGAFWLQGSNTSHRVPGGIQNQYDQMNKLNTGGYSVEPESMTSGINGEAVSTVLNASLHRPSGNMTAPSESMLELLNKDDTSNDQALAMQFNSKVSTPRESALTETPATSFAKPSNPSPLPADFGFRQMPSDLQTSQSNSVFPPLSMVSSSLSSHMAAEVPVSGNAGFRMGQPTQWPPQHTTYNFSSNLFKSPDSASSRIGTSSTTPNEQQHYQNSCQQEYNTKQYSGNSPGLEQQFEKGRFSREGLNHVQKPEHFREHGLEAGSLINDDAKSFPPKYDSVNYQHPNANFGERSLSGQNSGHMDIKKSDLNEGQGDQSGKALMTSYHQNSHQQTMLSQNDVPTHSVGSNVAYPSQISLPMVQSWFNQYETSKNGQRLPIHDPRAAIPSSENVKDSSLNMQVNVANASQGSVLQSPTVLHKQLNTTPLLPSDVNRQNFAVTFQKKRKLVVFDIVPWHKEVNQNQSTPVDISTAELSWAQAANRREEEVISEAEIVEELHPVIQAKRRLISTTQLMQQVFRPAPSVIIFMDATSNCDYIAYYASRIALGDACSLTGQQPSNSTDVSESPDKAETSRRRDACKFSKVVDDNICRVKKLEDDLTRLEKSLSVVDIKVEAQELEKFSTINRFAKFHIRSQPNAADPASSATSALHKTHPQRYVVGHPMPKILPEGLDCISL